MADSRRIRHGAAAKLDDMASPGLPVDRERDRQSPGLLDLFRHFWAIFSRILPHFSGTEITRAWPGFATPTGWRDLQGLGTAL